VKAINWRLNKLEKTTARQCWVSPFGVALSAGFARLSAADREILEHTSFRAASSQYPEVWRRLDDALAQAYRAGESTFHLSATHLLLL
jgi:hypothetical protein